MKGKILCIERERAARRFKDKPKIQIAACGLYTVYSIADAAIFGTYYIAEEI